VYAALRNGGELHFGDIYCDRRIPDAVRKNEVLWGECLSGALYINGECICAEARVLSWIVVDWCGVMRAEGAVDRTIDS
jgi:hypothetical protein